MYYKKHVELYINYPNCIKNQKGTINPKNDNNFFECAVTVALNYEKVGKVSQRISNIKLFINNYYWKE